MTRLLRAGDRGWLLELDGPGAAHAVAARIRASSVAQVLEDVVPASTTVLVTVRDAADGSLVGTALDTLDLSASLAAGTSRVIEIPVRYDGADIGSLAASTGLSVAAIAELHSSADHVVAFFGFAPGFAYIDGTPAPLQVPRRDTPRTSTPVGGVAIAGGQTVIYPGGTPGGWTIIGTTDFIAWDLAATPPARLDVGDTIRFVRA